MVGLEDVPTYKRVAAWFPGPVEDMERYFQRLCRLNQGLSTVYWRVYKRKEKPNGVCLVLSINTASFAALEGVKWRPFSWVRQATVSLLGVKLEGNKQEEEGKKEEVEEGE